MDFEKELSEIYPWILKVARKFCCSMQDAEDLAGDTVYKLLVNRDKFDCCLLYTSPSPRDVEESRMPSSA